MHRNSAFLIAFWQKKSSSFGNCPFSAAFVRFVIKNLQALN